MQRRRIEDEKGVCRDMNEKERKRKQGKGGETEITRGWQQGAEGI